MTFTYSNTNVSSELARVRLLIADTDSTNALFTDEEIAFFLDDGGSVYMAAAVANRAIAATRALLARRVKIGDYEKDMGEVVKNLLLQADEWEKRAQQVAGTVALTRVDGYSSTIAANSV